MEEVKEIEVKELIDIFTKNIKVILTVVIWLAILGVIYGGFIKEPEYVSSAKVILVNDNEKEFLNKTDINLMQGELALNQKLVSTYSEIIKSRIVLEKVISRLNLNMTVDDLKGKIKVSTIDETEVINVLVKTKEGELSKNVANQLVKSFKEEVARIYKIENVQLVDKPVIGKYNFKLNAIKFAVIFSLLGVIVMYSMYFIMFIFNNKVSKTEDIEALKVNILGNIPISNHKIEEEGEDECLNY